MFFDTADVYNGGQSEVLTGRILRKLLRHARGVRRRDEGARPDDARRERARARAQARPRVDRRVARAARARLRRPVPDPPLGLRDADRGDDGGAARGREVRARRATSARAACTRGSSRRRRRSPTARLDAVRLDAEPLQPRLPRGGAGDDPAVHRPGRRRSCRGARSRAACSPGTARARASGSPFARRRTRSATRSTCRRWTSTSSTASSKSPASGASAGAGRARLAAAQAGRHGADRRGDEGRSTSTTRSRPSSSELSDDEIARLEEPYIPHAVSGHEQSTVPSRPVEAEAHPRDSPRGMSRTPTTPGTVPEATSRTPTTRRA